VGEIGFDYWWESAGNKERQLGLLQAQLPLCAKYSKPAVFHARNGKVQGQDAYADLLAALKSWDYNPAGRRRGVLHCFSGAWKDARAGLYAGLLLGINGTFTYKKNHDLRETARRAGVKNIVLETDCPYLPPQSARGKRNDPTYIPEIAAFAASHLGLSTGDMARITFENAVELFGSF
jgi:TatD DNase family protein